MEGSLEGSRGDRAVVYDDDARPPALHHYQGRHFGGVQPVTRELRAADNLAWNVCIEQLRWRVPGLRLPATPPTRDRVQSFQDRIDKQGLIDVLETAFLGASVKMAQHLGHLQPSDASPNWVQPSARNSIYGDGT